MKWRMCKCIARNIGYVLSYDFWKSALFDRNFPAKTIFLFTIFTAISDTVKMILVPGYPKASK